MPAALETQLSAPYRRESWVVLLRRILGDGVEIFVQPQDVPLTNDSERKLATGFRQFGRVTLTDGKIIGLFEIDAAPRVVLATNRVGLRSLVSRRIDQVNIHAVFAFFIQPGEPVYRLTFAARESSFNLDDLSIQTQETAARRFTYVLGPGELVRTAALRLNALSAKCDSATLADVTDAFSVETLNKEFFTLYKQHYLAFCHHLIDESDAVKRVFKINLEGLEDKARERALKPVRDFVKKLLGRLIFLHFLQRKGWLGCAANRTDWSGGPPDFIRQLFDSTPAEKKDRFHSARLVPLFFDTLNNPKRERDLFAVTGTRVPYLNGGLFERDFAGVEKLDFPAPLFDALLAFFGQYHFTIDENDPEDHEIGIDPEMLGHIFENLLEDNKDKGAYYTPKAVVQYMCRQSLVHALAGHFPGDPAARGEIETLIRSKEPIDARDSQSWLARHATALTQRLDELRICDPAIGSGAFPIGLLQEIYWTKLALNPSLDRARAKREIIQRSIHGVDLDAGAVEIARLRFWLALIVEESVPVPLPNLDYQIMQGNSLLESFEGERLEDLAEPMRNVGRQRLGSDHIELDLGTGGAPVEFTLPTLHTPAQHRLAELRCYYFACHEPEEKARLRAQIDAAVLGAIDDRLALRQHELSTALEDWQRDLKRKRRLKKEYEPTAREEKQRAAMQAELASLEGKKDRLHALLEDPRAERPFFLWHLWFRHVLAAPPEGRGGFDIVIGNPPYVRADNPDFLPQRAAILAEKRGSERAFVTLWEKWDLYMPFIEHGHALLRPGGVETMIVSDAYCHSKYAIKSQDWFLKNAVVHRLDLLGKLQIFDAGVKNMIFFYGRGDGAANIPERRVHTGQFGNVTVLTSEVQATATHRLFFPEGDSESLGEFSVETLPIEQICYITKGMVVHADEDLARGAFTLSDLVSDVCDDRHPRAFVEGKHLSRWTALSNKWLEWGTERAPSLFSRPTFPELYPAPKVFIHRTGGEGIRACLDLNGTLCNHTVMVCVPWHSLAGVRNKSIRKSAIYSNERKADDSERPDRTLLEASSRDFDLRFVLGVMNSAFARHLLRRDRRSNTDLYPDDWKKLPIPAASDAEQATLSTLVDRILAAKRAGDEATVAELEAEIDTHVFRLYGLTPDEISVVKESMATPNRPIA